MISVDSRAAAVVVVVVTGTGGEEEEEEESSPEYLSRDIHYESHMFALP